MVSKNPDSIPRYEQPMFEEEEEYDACETCMYYLQFSKADQSTIIGQLSPYGPRLRESKQAVRDIERAIHRCGFCAYNIAVVACGEHCEHHKEA